MELEELLDIIESGPVAYEFNAGVWTSPMIRKVIEDEFQASYCPSHVTRILHSMGFPVQRPNRSFIQADLKARYIWVIDRYPEKKKAREEEAVILFEDEASFRQEPTLYQTWAKSGNQPIIPTMAVRNFMKVFGTVDLYTGRFLYHFARVFNADTYEVWDWIKDERKYLKSYYLPAYSPEYNAMERFWHHTRMNGTHNRFFNSEKALYAVLVSNFRSIQHNPLLIPVEK